MRLSNTKKLETLRSALIAGEKAESANEICKIY